MIRNTGIPAQSHLRTVRRSGKRGDWGCESIGDIVQNRCDHLGLKG